MNTHQQLQALQAGLLFIIFLLMLYQRISKQIYALKYTMVVVLFGSLRALLDMTINADRNVWGYTNNLHFWLNMASVIVWYIYGEMVLNDKPNPIRLAIVFFITGTQIAAHYVGSMFYYNDPRINVSASDNVYKNPVSWFFYNNGNTADTPFWELPIDILQIFVFMFLIWVYLRMSIFSYGKKAFKSSVAMIISIVFLLMGSFFEFSEHFGAKEINGSLSMAPGFALLAFVYIYNPRFSFAAPVQLQRVIIMHRNGVMIGNHVFVDKYVAESSNELASSMITSVNKLFQEMTRTQADIEIIKSSTSTMLFAYADKVTILFELDKSTYLIKNSLKELVKEFSIKFADKLKEDAIFSEDYDNFPKLLYKYFPILD